MTLIEAGVFTMGSDRFYPEEAPVRSVRVSAFLIDTAPVTNGQFAAFVADTGYVTEAEVAPDRGVYPDLLPELDYPGSLVFTKTSEPVPLDEPHRWWRFEPGAHWRRPLGMDSDLTGLEDHPVVHVSFADASAYAAWAGKSLPTEAEWEFAARGGLEAADYAWGMELSPGGRRMANYWHGLFPFANQRPDGWEWTSPVGSYPANGFGLFDMIGNTWEWTADWWWQPAANRNGTRSCCAIANPRGGSRAKSADPALRGSNIPRKVIKGGSHLCAENYCRRYRPAARHPQAIDAATSHIGFRCIRRIAS